MRIPILVFILGLMCSQLAQADSVTIPLKLLLAHSGDRPIGSIKAEDTRYGLLLTPQLAGLTPGIYGFHVHEHPSCAKQGAAAGGHLDPARTKQHLGPYNAAGHLGDLPVLVVGEDGRATLPVLAPRLRVQQLLGHSLMIHAGADNYADEPQPLGGGGGRMACGVVPSKAE